MRIQEESTKICNRNELCLVVFLYRTMIVLLDIFRYKKSPKKVFSGTAVMRILVSLDEVWFSTAGFL